MAAAGIDSLADEVVDDVEGGEEAGAAEEEVTLEELKRRLQEAIATENYELASELKKRIDDQTAG